MRDERKIKDGYFELDGCDHKIGDENCLDCWAGFPIKCDCGGLIHAEFGDENYDGDYWLYKKCDKCGGDYKNWD